MILTLAQQIYLAMVVVAFAAFILGLLYGSWTAYARPRQSTVRASDGTAVKAAAKA